MSIKFNRLITIEERKDNIFKKKNFIDLNFKVNNIYKLSNFKTVLDLENKNTNN